MSISSIILLRLETDSDQQITAGNDFDPYEQQRDFDHNQQIVLEECNPRVEEQVQT